MTTANPTFYPQFARQVAQLVMDFSPPCLTLTELLSNAGGRDCAGLEGGQGVPANYRTRFLQ